MTKAAYIKYLKQQIKECERSLEECDKKYTPEIDAILLFAETPEQANFLLANWREITNIVFSLAHQGMED